MEIGKETEEEKAARLAAWPGFRIVFGLAGFEQNILKKSESK